MVARVNECGAADGDVWTVKGELLAANVVRLNWATTRDAESTSSTFRRVGDGSQQIWISSTGHNSTLETVRLLNGSTTSCDVNDGRASVLMDCDVTDPDNNVGVMVTLYHHQYQTVHIICEQWDKSLYLLNPDYLLLSNINNNMYSDIL